MRRLPCRPSISEARMAGAVGQATDGCVAAKAEIVCCRIANGPAALARGKLDERAARGAVDRFLRNGCLRERGLEDPTLRQDRRPPRPRPGSDCGRCSAPQMEAMDFSDDRVARQPDLAGNLPARKSSFDKAPQLIDTFGGPGSGFRVHGMAPRWSSRHHAASGCWPGRVIDLLNRRDSSPAAARSPFVEKRHMIRFALQGL